MLYIYTNPTCPYCKAVKDELEKANISFVERITSDWHEHWKKISHLTGAPNVPTLDYTNSKGQQDYFIPGRDFRSAQHVVEIINNYNKPEVSNELFLVERLKTLNYNISVAFSRTDQLLKQIENKLNTNDKESN